MLKPATTKDSTTALVTLNPTVDLYYSNQANKRYGKKFFNDCMVAAGGGGVNVARGLSSLGKAGTIYTVTAGKLGEHLRALLEKERLDYRFVAGEEEPRIVTIMDGEAQRMLVGPTPLISRKTVERFLTHLYQEICRHQLVLLSGSVPDGVVQPLISGLLRPLVNSGVRVVLDTRGQLARDGMMVEGVFALRFNRDPSTLSVRHIPHREVLRILTSCHIEGCRYVFYANDTKIYALFTHRLWRYSYEVSRRPRLFGRGDALMAGLISATHDGLPPQRAVTFAVACAAAYETPYPLGRIAAAKLAGHIGTTIPEMIREVR